MTTNIAVGGLIGYNNCDISDSYATGNITSGTVGHVGGLTGINYGSISNSYATGNITSSNRGSVGGLTGINDGSINNSYSTGDVISHGDAGGITGLNFKNINGCYATGDIETTGRYAGGITGNNLYKYSIISNSCFTGNVKVKGSCNAGGIAGENYQGAITNCYTIGDVTVIDAEYARVGGIAGVVNGSSRGYGIISRCYAVGKVTVLSSEPGDIYAGGIAGWLNQNSNITSSYFIGDVTASSTGNSGHYYYSYYTCVGGIIGRSDESNNFIENCYSAGDVTATATIDSGYGYTCAGGIIGYAGDGFYDDINITSCYTTSNVTATSTAASGRSATYVGGIAGINNRKDSITSCAALNISINAIDTNNNYAGRIAGNNIGKLSGNYAKSTMLVNGVTVTDDQTSPLTNKQGKGITIDDISTETWWSDTLGWDFTNAWNWKDGYLPYLNEEYKVDVSSLSNNFSHSLVKPAVSLTLVTSGAGLALYNGDGGDAFLSGDTVTVTATPDAGYVFVGWVDEDGKPVSSSEVYKFKIVEDMTLTAVFEESKTETAYLKNIKKSKQVRTWFL